MKSLISFILCLTFAPFVFSQSLEQKIARSYAGFEADKQLDFGVSSLTVLDGTTGEILFSKNADLALAPASTLKTITSATAYYLLGKDYRWKTTLGYRGAVNNGLLKGDLILKGSGDPSLGSDRYHQSKAEILIQGWVAAVKLAGIRKIEGRVLVDDSLFGSQTVPQGWIWQDIGNYYGAGASSASWRENEFGIAFKPGYSAGDVTKVLRTEPPQPDIRIVNEVTTGKAGSGDNVYAYSAPFTNIVYARGTYGSDLNKLIMVSMPDPAMELAVELKDALYKAGIKASLASTWRKSVAEGKAVAPADKIISEYASPTLGEIVYWLNQKSLNLYAENILKTLAVEQGKKGTFEDGITVLKDFWIKKLGLDENSLNILDGSGLSPENRVSTASMAKILQSAASEPWFGSYFESFPRYNDMNMKSGSIRNVLCYTGYQKTASGRSLVFSIMTNNYNGSSSAWRQKMFRMLDALK